MSKMELRIWQYGLDDHYIPSLLEGMSLAHGEPIRNEEWFHWKFEQSPYGKAVIACAFDENRVAGCVAYGMGRMKYQGKEYCCALSYETFVHPNYQGKGLFKKLIQLAENEMIECGKVKFLYNYPNSNSLTGFKHMGWTERNDLKMFRIRIENLLHVAFHVRDIKKSFLPSTSNLDAIISNDLTDIITDWGNEDVVLPIWTSEYLKWRFFTYPNRYYHVLNTSDFFAISMVGFRGKLKDVHLLYAVSKHEETATSYYAKTILKRIKDETNPDLISYSTTKDDSFLDRVNGFITVPSHSNFCYKIINSDFKIDTLKIILPSINAHTY